MVLVGAEAFVLTAGALVARPHPCVGSDALVGLRMLGRERRGAGASREGCAEGARPPSGVVRSDEHELGGPRTGRPPLSPAYLAAAVVTELAACWITRATSFGRETKGTWLDLISVVVAPMRLA
jgi:hypothetical protein